MLVHGVEHVLRGAWAEMASRAVDFAEDVLMKEDGLSSGLHHEGGVALEGLLLRWK